eukprot:scaffold853_cov386-Prasinococcus_capsulatus_cf.AAC.5
MSQKSAKRRAPGAGCQLAEFCSSSSWRSFSRPTRLSCATSVASWPRACDKAAKRYYDMPAGIARVTYLHQVGGSPTEVHQRVGVRMRVMRERSA